MFGRIQFHQGKEAPKWWGDMPAQPHQDGFTKNCVEKFLARRQIVPIKASLLMLEGFAGIGNWMADEILWRARVNPKRRVETLSPAEVAAPWKQTKWVSREAMKHVAPAF